MAYVNEKIPKEEIKEYIMPDYGKKMPYSRTIDKEKNMMLLTYGRNIDEPSEEHFVLMKDEKIIFSAVLWQDVDENTVIWSMCGYKVWKECQFSKEEILEEFREALKVYGYSGYTIVKSLKNIETIIKF